MRPLPLILGVTLVLLCSVSARAFEHVTTDTGAPTHWQQRCVPWKIHSAGSEDVSFSAAHEALEQAIGAWEGVPESFITFEDHGTTSANTAGMPGGAIENIVVWHESGEWPHALRVVGLTSLTYDMKTGQIVDADIELNGDDYTFAADGDADAYDIQQSLTHEIGHLLGLDHSPVEEAVMFADSHPGETSKRELHDDDVNGLIASHPAAARPTVDGCVVHETSSDGGCSGANGAAPDGSWAILLCLGLWFLGRRQRTGMMLVALMLCAAPARAGTPYTTESGTPVFWPDDTMVYTLHPALPDGLAEDAVEEAIGRGFDAWENIECQPLVFDSAGWSTCPGEDTDDAINCIRWRDRVELWAWPTHLVAVTLVHYWEDTGVIEDVDMEINAFAFSWSTDLECQPEDIDLVSTITHEAGHFVGLDHSLEEQATMNESTTAGDCQKRSLETDDEETFCGTYASRPDVIAHADGDGEISSVDATSPEDTEDDGSTSSGGGSGCAGAGGLPASQLALSVLIVWLLSRRRCRAAARVPRAH